MPARPGIRSRAVFIDGSPSVASYREFTQHFPQPGLGRARRRRDLGGRPRHAARRRRPGRRRARSRPSGSPTSARPSWPGTAPPAEPYGRAIVWQDRRTAARCDELAAAGALDLVRQRTGLVLDPYFSGTKFEWLLREGDVPVDRRPGARHDRRLADLEPHRRRGLHDGRHQRQPHDAVRHHAACAGTRSCATCSTCPSTHLPAVAAVERARRRHVGPLRRAGRHPDQRHRRRPAGGAVRPGLLRARDGQEHVRHGQLRAAQRRRRPVPPPSDGHADDGGLDAGRRHGGLRPGGADLLDRIGDPVAARRARDHRRRGRDRSAGRQRRRQRRGLRRAGVHRARVTLVGSRTPGARSSGSPAARPEPTSPGPWSSRWRTRPEMPSRRWCGPAASRCTSCGSTVVRR